MDRFARIPLAGFRLRGAALGAGIAALALLLAACGGQLLDEIEPVEGVTEVAVEDNRFEPRVIRVPAGAEVAWDWQGSARHNVVGDGGFQSDLLREGTFAHTFEAPGTYNYLCTLHTGMTGRVIVE